MLVDYYYQKGFKEGVEYTNASIRAGNGFVSPTVANDKYPEYDEYEWLLIINN